MSEVANVKRDIPAECEAFRDMAAGWKTQFARALLVLAIRWSKHCGACLPMVTFCWRACPVLVKHCWCKLFRNPPGCAPRAFSARQT